MTEASMMLKELGFELLSINRQCETWVKRSGNCEITFNVSNGEQVSKIQTIASHCGPLNSNIRTYEAMVARMKEREREVTYR